MLSVLLFHKEEQGSAYSFHTVQTREEAELEELMSSLGDPDTFFYQNKHSKTEERGERQPVCFLNTNPCC